MRLLWQPKNRVNKNSHYASHSIDKKCKNERIRSPPTKATMILDGNVDTSNRLICCIPIKATMILDVITRQHYYQTNLLHLYQSYNGLGGYQKLILSVFISKT